MNTDEKLAALRARMRARGLDAYIVLSEDAHRSEYVAEHWRGRAWLSGFDGSAGEIAATHDRAALWADGRYYIQAAQQIAGSAFELVKIGMDDIEVCDWLANALPPGAVVGIDGRTLSVSAFKKYDAAFRPRGIQFVLDADLLSDIWPQRPALPADAVFEHDIAFAGKTRAEKLGELRARMRKRGVNAYLISSLDDIAWLFNLRGGDIAFTPVFYSYAFVDAVGAHLFVNPEKLDDGLRQTLADEGISVHTYDAIAAFLRKYGGHGAVLIDPDRTSIYVKRLFSGVALAYGSELTAALKAVKNETELRNIRQTQVHDGVAMVKFIKWVKEHAGSGTLEEADIHDVLIALRAEQPHFMGASFGTIAAYMENAASMHYAPVKGASAQLAPHGMLLVDSGGQYLGGTTDITRTIALGELPDGMKRDFTLVLRAHIALATAGFLYGACGSYLDVIPRRVMWAEGMDYKCGTGHGIGYFLTVHEGPHRIRMTGQDAVKLEPGMLVTNEPGVYKEGAWGIRTENTMLVVDDFATADGRFLKFETISYCPIDLAAVDVRLLSADERAWLNSYHAEVYERLAPLLDEAHRLWLAENTRAV